MMLSVRCFSTSAIEQKDGREGALALEAYSTRGLLIREACSRYGIDGLWRCCALVRHKGVRLALLTSVVGMVQKGGIDICYSSRSYNSYRITASIHTASDSIN